MRPLVVLGIDAGDPHWIVNWAAQGRLPHLAALMERGAWARTSGDELLFEHGVWTTLCSGVGRGETGHYYFRQLAGGSYDLVPISGLEIAAKPIWASFRESCRRALIFDVPDVFPVEGVPGVQVANWAPHRGWASDEPAMRLHAHPAPMVDELHRIAGDAPGLVELPGGTPAQSRALRQALLEQIRAKGALCRALLEQGPFDLTWIVFGESHTGGHQLWDYRPGGCRAGEAPDLVDALEELYVALDAEIGALLERRPDANVLVLSSVRMADHYPNTDLVNQLCQRLGYWHRRRPPLRLTPLGLARRVLPERWRVAASRTLSRDRRERLLAESFREGTDWAQTTVAPLPAYFTTFFRVNLRGREPQGIVAPGAECEALLDRLEDDLRQVIDARSGEPVLERVTRREAAFGPEAHPSLPDMMVHWRSRPYLMTRWIHPRAEVTQGRPEFFRSTDHAPEGFFLAAGPDVAARGELPSVDALDVAPTALELLGEPIPPSLRGRPLPLARVAVTP